MLPGNDSLRVGKIKVFSYLKLCFLCKLLKCNRVSVVSKELLSGRAQTRLCAGAWVFMLEIADRCCAAASPSATQGSPGEET